MNEYLTIDSNEYLCTSSLREIAAWLDASQRSRDGLRLNRAAREYSAKSALSNAKDWILRCVRTHLYFCLLIRASITF